MEFKISERYWVFTWPEHEAGGGMSDFKRSYASLDDAIYLLKQAIDDPLVGEGHIFDKQTAELLDLLEAEELLKKEKGESN